MDIWAEHWHQHQSDVQDHFRGREKDLLVFNIDQHSSADIAEFFKEDFALTGELDHLNKSGTANPSQTWTPTK